MQTLSYVPDISHHERKLYCVYSQADENGREILSKEDHITLSIFYLEEPAEGKRELPEAEVSQQFQTEIKCFFYLYSNLFLDLDFSKLFSSLERT